MCHIIDFIQTNLKTDNNKNSSSDASFKIQQKTTFLTFEIFQEGFMENFKYTKYIPYKIGYFQVQFKYSKKSSTIQGIQGIQVLLATLVALDPHVCKHDNLAIALTRTLWKQSFWVQICPVSPNFGESVTFFYILGCLTYLKFPKKVINGFQENYENSNFGPKNALLLQILGK